MALIVTGHQRSGTSLLARLLNAHPEVRLTSEFGNFLRVGSPPGRYIRRLLKRWGGLTPAEIDTVMKIAGPTMERLGYC